MSSKLTTFGRITRMLRVEHDEFLKDMARHLGVTPGYLSAVERGQRNAPHEWVDLLQEAYSLSGETAEAMKRAVVESRTHNTLDISHLSFEDKHLIETMSKKLTTFDVTKREQLCKLMGRERSD